MPSVAKAGRNAEIQDRDVKILRGLFEARLMTAEHVAAIYFEGRYEAARKRLQKLKAAGYVGERPRRAYDPAVCFLTRMAFTALTQTGAISDLPQMSWASLEKRVRVSDLTLRHELEVQDVRAAFYQDAINTPGIEVAEFSTWPALFQFQAFDPAGRWVTIKPDGFIRLEEERPSGECFQHFFFLEVDRSTEPQETLVTRAMCYRDYYRRGGLAVRYGQHAAQFEAFPFRVLVIFRTAERRDNFAHRLLSLRPPILTQSWLTTRAAVTASPLAAVWRRPSDYRSFGTRAVEESPRQGLPLLAP